jgi:hypothetical protein
MGPSGLLYVQINGPQTGSFFRTQSGIWKTSQAHGRIRKISNKTNCIKRHVACYEVADTTLEIK